MKWRDDNERLEFTLSQYLDGELSPKEQAELRSRLAGDEALRDELRRYTALQQQIDEANRAELDGIDYDAQRGEIIAAVERKILLEGQPRRRPLVLRPAFGIVAVAAAAVLLVTSVALWRLGQTPAPTDGPAVIAMILPESSQTVQAAEPVVRLMRMEEQDLVMAPFPSAGADTLPPGTVVVSVGSRAKPRAAAGMLAGMFPIE